MNINFTVITDLLRVEGPVAVCSSDYLIHSSFDERQVFFINRSASHCLDVVKPLLRDFAKGRSGIVEMSNKFS